MPKPRWTKASAAELALATLPSQRDDLSGMNCSLGLKHACVGHPRFWHFNSRPPADVLQRASLVWTPGSAPPQSHGALTSFSELMHRQVLSAPQCTFDFLGDSMSNDGWVAAVVAAMRLGFKLTSCRNSGALSAAYWKHEAQLYGQSALCPQVPASKPAVATFVAPESAKARCPTIFDGAGNGPRVTLRYQNLPTTPEAAAQLLEGASVLMANIGLHANSISEYVWRLEVQVRPLLQALANAPERLLLWRESTPQHFVTACGSGLWEDRIEHGDATHACAAVTNRTRANWRNEQFARWLGEWPADVRRRVLVVHAFDFLLERHDLHAPLDGAIADCTHFLYSPFVWAHVWDGANSAFRFVNRTTRATAAAHANRTHAVPARAHPAAQAVNVWLEDGPARHGVEGRTPESRASVRETPQTPFTLVARVKQLVGLWG